MTKRLDPQLKAARAATRKEARAALRIAHREWWADLRADDCTYAVSLDNGTERIMKPDPQSGASILHKDGVPSGEFVAWCAENGIPCSEEPDLPSGIPTRYRSRSSTRPKWRSRWRAPAVKAEPVDDHQRFMIRLRWH